MASKTLKYRSAWLLVIAMVGSAFSSHATAEESAARRWNELTLESIRNDFARPIVHARNLFHMSAAMFDAWSTFDESTVPWLVDDSIVVKGDLEQARIAAISHAAFTLLNHRFAESPGFLFMQGQYRTLMLDLGLDPDFTDTQGSGPAALGNRIGHAYIAYGLLDGAREDFGYDNRYYESVNRPLFVAETVGNNTLDDPNRWQPLGFEDFIDQSGNTIEGGVPPFIGAEWGLVSPFSLRDDQQTVYRRGFDRWYVYLDPGSPPLIGTADEEAYLEGFEQVLVWSSHLAPTDGVDWDISPNSIGNASLPASPEDDAAFYDFYVGGDAGVGYTENPVTGELYPEQIVPRGDYARVLAEFWADGPDSETPPGHWFTILNDVMDHPAFLRRLGGVGPELDALDYDVQAYFAMGGCMHDAAIAAWSVKGWYDYIRPVSAIRWMAQNGQRSDPSRPSYDPRGLRLIPGLIELVTEETAAPGGIHEHLAGSMGENIGKIAALCWRGPDYIDDPDTDEAGIGWTLAEAWWPYQRPTFVTPNFAGYVSGHSTYSRAAAELMTKLTGSEYFPGGLGEYVAPANEFLVFEEGPSVDVVLQWASYRDASDQCSLSRIWGGIHPPADDLPGRRMGLEIGPQAWELALEHFGLDCPADLDGDGGVGPGDLGVLISNWSCSGFDCLGDLDGDGVVGPGDLGPLIAAWGDDC